MISHGTIFINGGGKCAFGVHVGAFETISVDTGAPGTRRVVIEEFCSDYLRAGDTTHLPIGVDFHLASTKPGDIAIEMDVGTPLDANAVVAFPMSDPQLIPIDSLVRLIYIYLGDRSGDEDCDVLVPQFKVERQPLTESEAAPLLKRSAP